MTREEIEAYKVDRTDWGPGPWDGEPDRLDFEHAGLPCLLRRGPVGAWCGYAGVPPGHPLHGVGYDEAPALEVHWGLTFAGGCEGTICHVPKPGEPDNVWWLGWDCAHAGDYAPHIQAVLRRLRSEGKLRDASAFETITDAEASGERFGPARQQHHMPWPLGPEVYRDLAFARAETERLAEQLAGLA